MRQLLNIEPPAGTVIIAASRTHLFAVEQTRKAAEFYVCTAADLTWVGTKIRVFGLVTQAAAWGTTLFYTTRAATGVFALSLTDTWRVSNCATLVDYDAETNDLAFYPLDARTCLFRFYADARIHLVRIVFGDKIKCTVLSHGLPSMYFVVLTERNDVWAVSDAAVHVLTGLPEGHTGCTIPVRFDHTTVDGIVLRPRGAYYVTSQYTGPCIAIEYESMVRLTPVLQLVGETRPSDYVKRELLEIRVTCAMDVVCTATNMYIVTLAGSVVAVYLPALSPDVYSLLAPDTSATVMKLGDDAIQSNLIHPVANGVAGAVMCVETSTIFSVTTRRWCRVYESETPL